MECIQRSKTFINILKGKVSNLDFRSNKGHLERTKFGDIEQLHTLHINKHMVHKLSWINGIN